MDSKKRNIETLGNPENKEAFANSAELANFGGIQYYVRWDV